MNMEFIKRRIIPVVWIILLNALIHSCSGHGRLIEPPSRSSAWRYGFQTPPNYNDHELYCGGFTRQWSKNDGKCGVCGDAWDTPTPRANEFGGKWGQGVIVRRYNPGADVILRVELTASHMGFFEFRVCPDVDAQQDCLDKNVLRVLGGSPIFPVQSDVDTRFYPRNGSRIYEVKAKLPTGLKCSQCILQWRYVAGNNWGICTDGTGAVGCGPQEEFRACADISIGDTGRTTIRPFHPDTKTTIPPKTSAKTPESGTGEDFPETSPFVVPVIIFLTLLVVICLLAAIYFYIYHGQRVKQLLHWRRNIDPPSSDETELNKKFDLTIVPDPPPRRKRLSQVKHISPNESSIVFGQSSSQNII